MPVALSEFRRALKPDGFLVITCPDLKSVCALAVEDKPTEAAYTSPAGPMAHRCGFTEKVLRGMLQAAGFAAVAMLARERTPFFDLWSLASVRARH